MKDAGTRRRRDTEMRRHEDPMGTGSEGHSVSLCLRVPASFFILPPSAFILPLVLESGHLFDSGEY
jgi:hypothetical protein